MEKRNLLIAIFLGVTAVILGAFGAHALKEQLTAEALQSFEVGVRYQMFHAIVLLFVSGYSKFPAKSKNLITAVMLIGILLFSGSIYAISMGIDAKLIWFVTPLGGLMLIIGWLLTGNAVLKNVSN